jgi:hypothetical protein
LAEAYNGILAAKVSNVANSHHFNGSQLTVRAIVIHPLVEDGSLPVRSGYESFTRLGMVIRPIHFVGTAEAPFQLLPTK